MKKIPNFCKVTCISMAALAMLGCTTLTPEPENVSAKNAIQWRQDFDYSIEGHIIARPTQVFTDGKNTYLQFRDRQPIGKITDGNGKALTVRDGNSYKEVVGIYPKLLINLANQYTATVTYNAFAEQAVAVTPTPTPTPKVLPISVPSTVHMPAPVPAIAPTSVVKQATTAIAAPVAAIATTPIVQTPIAKPVAAVLAPTPTPTTVAVPTPASVQVTAPVSVGGSLSKDEVKIESKPVKPAEKPADSAGLKLYAIGSYEKTALQVLSRWANVAGYRLILNDVPATAKFPSHAAEYVDLPLLPEHYKLPISDTLEAAVASLAKPFGRVDMSGVLFVVNPQTNIKTIMVSSRAAPAKPVAAPATVNQPAAAQAQVSTAVTASSQPAAPAVPASAQTPTLPAVGAFALNASDKSLIGVLTRWAKQAGYQTQLNGTAVDSATFPVHAAAFTDFGLTQAAQALKPAGTFVVGLQGIMGAFANQDLSQFRMQLLNDKRVLVITSNDPTKASIK